MMQEKKLKQKQMKEQQLVVVDTPKLKKIEAKSTEHKEQSYSTKQVAMATKTEVNQKQITAKNNNNTSVTNNSSTTKTEITEESESTITTTTTTTITTTTTTTTKKISSSKVVSSLVEEKHDNMNKAIEGSESPSLKITPYTNKMLIKDHHEDTPTTATNEVDESLAELLKVTQHHINTIRRSDAKRIRAQSVPIPMLLDEEYDVDDDDDEDEENTYGFSSEEEILQNIRQNNPSIVEGKIDNIISNIKKGKFNGEIQRKESDSEKTIKLDDEGKSIKDEDESLDDISDSTEVVKFSDKLAQHKINANHDELNLLKDLKTKLPIDRFPESLIKRVDSKIDSLDYNKITVGVN